MSTNTASPGGAARHSIDSRLDAIDRALLGLLCRHDRIELVTQIEAKLRDALAASPPVEAHLGEAHLGEAHLGEAHLGEAHLGEAAGGCPERFDEATETAGLRSAGQSPASFARRRFLARRQPRSRLAVSSGVLGMVSLALLIALPIVYFAAAVSGDELITLSLLGGHLTAVAFGGLLAVVLGVAALAVLSRREGRLVGHGWAVTGLCTGPLPMFAGALLAIVALAHLQSMAPVSPVYTARNVGTAGSVVVSADGCLPQGAVGPGYPTNPYPAPAPSTYPVAAPAGYPVAWPAALDANVGYAPGAPMLPAANPYDGSRTLEGANLPGSPPSAPSAPPGSQNPYAAPQPYPPAPGASLAPAVEGDAAPPNSSQPPTFEADLVPTPQPAAATDAASTPAAEPADFSRSLLRAGE